MSQKWYLIAKPRRKKLWFILTTCFILVVVFLVWHIVPRINNGNFADTFSYIDNRPVSRSWIKYRANGEVELIGAPSVEIGVDDSGEQATLTIISKYQGALLARLVPVEFSTTAQCKKYLLAEAQHNLVRVVAQPQDDNFFCCFMVGN